MKCLHFKAPPPLPPFSFILLKIWFGPINSLIWLKTLHEAISLKMTDFKKRRLVPPLLTVWRNSTISTIVKGILLSPISTYISFYPLISLLNFPIIFGYFTTHFIPCHCHYWLSNQKFFPFGYQPTNHPSNTTYSQIWMFYRMAYEMLYYL